MGDVLDILALRAGYNTSVVLAGATLLGVAAGVVGTFTLLRRRALMSDALAHATFPGIVGAFLAAALLGVSGRSMPVLLVGAAVAAVMGVLSVHALSRSARINEDAAIAVVLSVFFGLGAVLLSYVVRLEAHGQAGLRHFLLGQPAAMSAGEAKLIGAVAVVAVVACAALFKELRLVCFDRSFARAQGWPVDALDLGILGLVVVVTVIGLQSVGLVLIVALLITPAAAARFWTERLWLMTVLGAVLGGVSCYVGVAISAVLPRAPAGAVIVLTASAVFLVSLFFAPNRGVAARAVRSARFSLDVEQQHLLRAVYEAVESSGAGSGGAVDVEGLGRSRSWSRARFAVLLRVLALRGWVRVVEGEEGRACVLTGRGEREALRVTRNHRLWEQYLISHAELAPTHVDRSADMIEHVLGRELVERLEEALRGRGALPVPLDERGAPPSPHPIHGGRGRGAGGGEGGA